MNANFVVNTLLEYGLPTGADDDSQRQISVNDIFNALPPGVDQQIIDIFNTEPDSIKVTTRLKALLRQHAAALEKTGLVPDYAAYALIYAVQQAQANQARNN